MLKLKRNSTKPDLAFYDVKDETGTLMDLTLAKSIIVKGYRKDVSVFSRDITASGTADGTCHMHWVPTSGNDLGDTAIAGRLKVELWITFWDDTVIKIPNDGYFEVEVTKDLDSTQVPD